MSGGPNRLGTVVPPEFASPIIDRARPIRFRLNGRQFSAFAGDTVLSALIANGVKAVGPARASLIALDAASAPAICLEGNQARPDLAMPMDMCPAIDGARFVTTGDAQPRAGIGRLLTSRASLGLPQTDAASFPGGWIDAPAQRTVTTDVVVVGAGVAGLSAALAAAERGLKVAIVEREPVLGGVSMFFGRAEGEPVPEDLIATLATRIGKSGLITLHLNTLAFDLDGTTLRAVKVARTGDQPEPEHLAITGNHVVLATGAVVRLPIFPGNRLPGVVDAISAWRLAARYNVWPAGAAHVHTATNAGYRMALLGGAAERPIARTTDPRHAPQTRFIEFCKAYGYRLGWGTSIASATRQGDSLKIELIDSLNGKPTEDSLVCERLIVSGGWQPDLDLWLKAGGAIHWATSTQKLLADSDLPHVALAGAAANYQSLRGCADHGAAAMTALIEGGDASASDPQIDPIFETPDGQLTITAPADRSHAPAWISPARVARLPRPQARGLMGLVRRPDADIAPASRALMLLDLAGIAASGAVAADDIASFATEHAVLPIRLDALAPPKPTGARPDPVPAYLGHRFGADQSLWTLKIDSGRNFEPGCLVFLNTDERSPLAAVGVVIVGTAPNIEIIAASDRLNRGDTVYVRDGLAVVAARLTTS